MRFCSMLVAVVCTFITMKYAIAFEITSVPCYENLGRREFQPLHGQPEAQFTLSQAGGEMRSGVVMIDNTQPGERAGNFTVTFHAPDTGKQPLPLANVSLGRILPLRHQGIEDNADQILPMKLNDTFDCPAGERRYIWITVDSRNLQPGEYHARLHVKKLSGAKQSEKSIDMIISVWPFNLPSKLPINVFTWDYGVATSTDAWHQEFVDHKINSWHMQVGLADDILISPDGTLQRQPDFSGLTEGIRRAKQSGGIMLFESSSFRKTQFGNTTLDAGWPVVGGGQAPYMSDAWQKAFTQWLRAFVSYLQQEGVDYDQWLWYPYDEEMSEVFLAQVKLVRDIDPQIKVFADPVWFDFLTRGDELKNEWAPSLGVFCPRYRTPINPYEESEIAIIRASGAKFWNYFCGVRMRGVSPSAHYRSRGWAAWRYKLDGISFWRPVVVNDNEKPTDPQATPTIYQTPDGFARTRRWEAWRDGIQDYQYLVMLEELAAKAPQEQGDAARILMAEVSKYVLMYNATDETQANTDPWVYEDARKKVANAIMQLRGD